ncbi:MAG TPA: 30S ribosomal protein S16 [Flavobacteriales bacterium]|nr:30S ribosomal protein S16 [Flavobacteriales bacterium]
MATKIRLQRHGKKGKPFFHLVAADSRSPRDGRFIEKLGVYNPTTNPATIDIHFDRCLHWVSAGAETTDTARAILAYKGVMYKNHLNIGVKKGAMTQEQADAKFEKWAKEKEAKIQGKKEGLSKKAEENTRNRKKHESDVNAAKAKQIAAKQQEAVATAKEEPAAETAPETTDKVE